MTDGQMDKDGVIPTENGHLPISWNKDNHLVVPLKQYDGEPDIYGSYLHYCPACECMHLFRTKGPEGYKGPKWDYNNDPLKPTFYPSMLLRTPMKDETLVCHYFIEAGKIKYLNDCTHALKGQVIPMVPA